jgi:predicted GNAT superfamily acetyltransferase
MPISIRPPATTEECEAIETLQMEIWGPSGVTPVEIIITMAKEGGVVLLALDDETPVGFVFGFIGLTPHRQLKLASHQAGVLPAYQDRGVGYQLKLAQREATLAKDIDYITWTFDPLQGRNAQFNLRKLGAVCNTYIQNLYGDMDDDLNRGLPSDRFRVDWWIRTEHVTRRLAGHFTDPKFSAECPILNPATLLSNGLLAPAERIDMPQGAYGLVEIPPDLARLKQEAPDFALTWRLQTRQIFETAFRMGYTAVDLLRREGRNYYLLQKEVIL